MSTQPQPQQQQIMASFNCIKCQNPMVAPLPGLRVFNAPDVSALMISHVRANKCPQCGTAYICLFNPQGIDQQGHLLFMWTPIQTPDTAIVPGTENNLQQALANKEIEGKIKLP